MLASITVALVAFALLVTVAVLLPRRYMMVRVDPETIAEALHERLKRDDLKALILQLIMIMDAPRQEQ